MSTTPNPYAMWLVAQADAIERDLATKPLGAAREFRRLAADYRLMAQQVTDATGFKYALCYAMGWHPRDTALDDKVKEAEAVGPRWVHNCALCVFLGQHGDADLWVHPTAQCTVIARYGNATGDYASSLEAWPNGHDHLDEAKRRAVERGVPA